ncbi:MULTISPECIES: hypothetical protein [Clostridium]|nr:MULTISPECIES: hypothetical protein [Clostridium]MDU1231587.1 hypothetical protein [Clostridium sp.]MDU3090418.1 hypothetical protein [Clostridium sp.]
MITHKKLKEVLKNWDIDEPISIEDIYYSNEERATNCWKINKKFIILCSIIKPNYMLCIF